MSNYQQAIWTKNNKVIIDINTYSCLVMVRLFEPEHGNIILYEFDFKIIFNSSSQVGTKLLSVHPRWRTISINKGNLMWWYAVLSRHSIFEPCSVYVQFGMTIGSCNFHVWLASDRFLYALTHRERYFQID